MQKRDTSSPPDAAMPGENKPRRVIDPLTAVGGILILAALSALVTYGVLTVRPRRASAGGPPDSFIAAATQPAERPTSTPLELDNDASAGTLTDDASASDPTSLAAQPSGPTPTFAVAIPSESATPTPIPETKATPSTAEELGLPSWAEVTYWLSIPRIEVEAPIMAFEPRSYDDEGNPVRRLPVPHAYLVGWDSASAEPGYTGNTVMTGHNNLWGAVFKRLDELVVGDEIAVWSEYGVFDYQVSDRIIIEEEGQPLEVRARNARFLSDTVDDRLTLITCWPRNGSSHRLIVIATRQ